MSGIYALHPLGRLSTETLGNSSAWGICLASPTYLFLSMWAHGYLLSTLGYYTVLLYFIAHMVWPSGALSVDCHVLWTGAIRVRCFFISFCALFLFLLPSPPISHTYTKGHMLPWCLVSQWHCSLLYKNHTRAVRSVGEFSLIYHFTLWNSGTV